VAIFFWSRRSFLRVQAGYRKLFAVGRLSTLEQIFDLPHVVVSGHASRQVARLRIGSGEGVEAYVKREQRVLWRQRLSNALAGFGWVSRSEREAGVLRQLHEAGVSCPEVLAWGESANGRALLLVAELKQAVDLRQWLGETKGSPLADKLGCARRLGSAIAAIHRAGFEHRDLYAKHIVVVRPDKSRAATEPSIAFLDWQHALKRRRVSWPRRFRDLAALHATVADHLASPRERLACLRAYLKSAKLEDDLVRRLGVTTFRDAAISIERHAQILLRRRRIREIRDQAPAGRSQNIVWAEGEAVCLTHRFHLELGNRLPAWLKVASPSDNEPQLHHHQLALPGGWRARLVRRRTSSWLSWLWARICGSRVTSPEIENAGLLFRLERYGVRIPRLLAFGQRQDSPWQSESFLLTEETPCGHDLVSWLRSHVEQPWSAERKQRRHVVREAGALYRRLHAAHCYVGSADAPPLLVGGSPGCPQVMLDRVDGLKRSKQLSSALAVADLAALGRLVSRFCSRTDQMRFLLSYLDLDELRPAAKKLAACVLVGAARKTRRIPA
jgi:tRNA A-37 threonylcarbamoyl transferase component Bud32